MTFDSLIDVFLEGMKDPKPENRDVILAKLIARYARN